MNEHEEEEEGYRGPADVVVGDRPAVTVQVQLAGNFEPISGRYVWHGRVRTLTDALGADADLSTGTELQITSGRHRHRPDHGGGSLGKPSRRRSDTPAVQPGVNSKSAGSTDRVRRQ